MTHGLSEQYFTSYEDTKIDDWIASKDEAFFRCGNPNATRKM